MSEKQPISSQLRQQRRVLTRLSGLFLIVLTGLFAMGDLSFAGWAGAGCLTAALVLGQHIYLGTQADRTPQAPEDRISGDDTLARFQARQALLGALPQPALVLREGQIETCNPAGAQLFGLPQETGGLSIASLRRPRLLDAIETVNATGKAASCDISGARRPGDAWRAEIVPLSDDPQSGGILVVFTDQRPVHRAQSARADFLANASHELRTPLTSLSGFVETMKGPAKDDMEAWPRFIDIMDEQIRHMRELIADLLSLSRIELSEHLPPETELNLLPVVNATLDALRQLAAERRLTLTLDASDVVYLITADEREIKQVVSNLVGNAMKYAPDSSDIRIEIGRAGSVTLAQNEAMRRQADASRATLLAAPEGAGGAIWLRVSDTGAGIEANHLPRLGERFYRVDDSRGGPVEGTGLGLAIVKHIVSRHRGGLAVESLAGQGAAFSVCLPARDVD